MAYIEKLRHPSGRVTYRARVRQKGAPDKSVCFPTRKAATEWGKRMEAEIRAGRYFGHEEDKEKTFSQFIDRYIENELPKNPKAYHKQKMLLSWWKAHLGKYFLCHITPAMIAESRDKLMSEKKQLNANALYAHLRERFENAQKIETSRIIAARSQTEAEKQLEHTETCFSRIRKRIKEMAAHFTIPEEHASLDILAQHLKEAKDKREWTTAAVEKERQLIEALEVETRLEAENKLKNKTLSDVEDKLTKIDGDLNEAEEEFIKCVEERRDALRAIEAIGGDSAVTLLDEKIHTKLLEIRNKTDRALALHLGLIAADQALVAYRDRHRSELLSQTSDVFREITNSEFSHLATQPDQANDQLIAIRSDGGSIAVEEMSKGTRFQLYLSLRLAAYRRFCKLRGPLPFIGDDIMETFDDIRTESALRQLNELAKNGQVLYFTHHRHLCVIAKKTFGEQVTIHEIPKNRRKIKN